MHGLLQVACVVHGDHLGVGHVALLVVVLKDDNTLQDLHKAQDLGRPREAGRHHASSHCSVCNKSIKIHKGKETRLVRCARCTKSRAQPLAVASDVSGTNASRVSFLWRVKF